MNGIYTRTITIFDDKFGEAVEIVKGLKEIRQKYYPDHIVNFSVHIGGNPRSIRETVIGEHFSDSSFDRDTKMSSDPKFVELTKKMKGVFKEGTMKDEFRAILEWKV